MSWMLQIEEGQMEDVHDEVQLRRRLGELQEHARRKPMFVVLHAPNGSSLAIGLGREVSVLSYAVPGGWPARHAVGDETNDALITFDYFGHFSEMPARYAVPVETALEATVEFFNSGKPTDRLLWEED